MKKDMNAGTNTRPATSNPATSRVENKDNLDSRKNEEQDFKGNDTTHNKKDVKSKKK